MMKQATTRFDKFTRWAKQALSVAAQEAGRRRQTLIEPEDLLVGILADPASQAVRALRAMGVAPETVRAATVTILDAKPTGPEGAEQVSGGPALSPRGKQVIGMAGEEVARLQQEKLATGHMLLGLLQEETSGAFLGAFGISLETARSALSHCWYPTSTQGLQTPSNEPLEYTQPAGAVQLDPLRQQRAVELAHSRQRAKRLFTLVVFVVVAALTIVAFLSSQLMGLLKNLVYALMSSPVLNWQPLAGWSPLLIFLTFLLISIPLLVISVPFSWYLSFVLPRRQGLRRGTAQSWWAQLGKGLLVLSLQIWLLAEVIMLLRTLQPQAWWAWAGLIQFLYSILFVRFSPIWLQPWLNRIEPLPEGELAERARALLARLHIPPCGLYQLKISHRTTAANAMFVGWGGGRRLLLTDTMIQSFPLDEIEVILAHELAHLVHHDIWTRLVLRGIFLLGVFALINLYFTSLGMLITSTFSSMMMLWAFSPLIGLLLVFAFASLVVRYRRYQEYQADEFALQVTGKVQAFKNAMIRLTNADLLVATSTKSARHPASHPTLRRRLQHAEEFAARQAQERSTM